MSIQFNRVFTRIPEARADYLRLTDNRSICGGCRHLANGGQLPKVGECARHEQVTINLEGIRCVTKCDGFERWSGDE